MYLIFALFIFILPNILAVAHDPINNFTSIDNRISDASVVEKSEVTDSINSEPQVMPDENVNQENIAPNIQQLLQETDQVTVLQKKKYRIF